MAPISSPSVVEHVDLLISEHRVVIFSKTTCGFSKKTKDLLKDIDVSFFALDLDQIPKGSEYQDVLAEKSGQRALPNIFINGKHIGGFSDIYEAHSSGKLLTLLGEIPHSYQYDLIVIGGGSGGLATAKAAARLGRKVACCDFVSPSPQGTTWGLGGTCVNVGCIPKKFMHQAALLGKSVEDARMFGWKYDDEVTHSWEILRDAVQDYIGSLNFTYRVQLREIGIDYHNAKAFLLDPHTVQLTNKKGAVSQITGNIIILAMGSRPIYPDIPGAKEFAVTSDDLFSLKYSPGKTLCVGASYVSLECAGFLQGVGFPVTVMVRSILLRGFDQQMAEKVGEYMENEGVIFQRGMVPVQIERVEDQNSKSLKVTAKDKNGQTSSENYDTVMIATGRAPCTSDLGLEKIGIKLNSSGYVIADDQERTSVDNIYAIGDILEGRLELTPLAIQTGQLLVRRLFAGSSELCDYVNVPTTVFTPLEYGAVGYTEEAAFEKYGENNIEVYHNHFYPYEWVIPQHSANSCYAKIICLKPEKDKVIGFHVVGPNCGEITQGFCVAMKAGATKKNFDEAIGIHPTSAEVFTTLKVTKRSGLSVQLKGCGG